MARILLGVTGGIAAYKALELARLATKAGHGVRVLMTPAAKRFVGAASFEGIVGAPGAHRRVRARPDPRRLPRRPRCPTTTRSATSRWSPTPTPTWSPRPPRTRSPSSPPGSPTRWSPPPSSPAAAPRLVAPAMNDRMYRDAGDQANLATLRERGVTVIEPEEGALASRGEHGVGPAARARERLLARDRGRCCRRAPALGRPAGPGLAPAAPASRSTRSASSATAPAAAWAWPWPSAPPPRRRGDAGRRQRRAADAAGRPPGGRRDRRRARGGAGDASSTPPHVLLMAAARRRLPAAARRRRRRSPARAAAVSSCDLEPTEDILAALGGQRGARARRSSASPPSTAADGVERAREKLERKGADAIVFNDVSRSGDRLRARRERGRRSSRPGASTQVPLASKEEVADAILDRVEALRSGVAGARARRLAALRTLPMSDDRIRTTPSTALPARHGAARGRRLRAGHGAARRGGPPGAREELGARGARPRLLPQPPASPRPRREFEAVVETHPVNDFAHFCLGRALSKTGEPRPRPPPPGAGRRTCGPERRDYRIYRERLRRAA